MSDTDPIGYVYESDLLCPTCIIDVANLYPSVGGSDPRDTEDRLDFCAGQLKINRSDEGTFDSGDFPKVYVGTPHDGCTVENGYEPGQCGDQCGGCGKTLGPECHNVGTDEKWLRELFEFECCAECGKDADRHTVTLDPFDNRHATCLDAEKE